MDNAKLTKRLTEYTRSVTVETALYNQQNSSAVRLNNSVNWSRENNSRINEINFDEIIWNNFLRDSDAELINRDDELINSIYELRNSTYELVNSTYELRNSIYELIISNAEVISSISELRSSNDEVVSSTYDLIYPYADLGVRNPLN